MIMKDIKDQTHYEILEVSPTATIKEIQRAYEHAKETFNVESLAIYSLFSEGDVKEIQYAIEEAYRVLMDEALRTNYHQMQFQTTGEQQPINVPETQVSPKEKKTSLSFIDLSLNAEEGVCRGKTLRQLRERMGIELQTISKETKISIKVLEWIEEEALEKLPPLVYLKSFLKNYAQSLGLNPQKVVEEYLQFLNQSDKK